MNYNELNFDAMTRERELSMSAAFPVLMRKVYVWMTLALVITGITAYGVASSPGVISALYSNQAIMWGLIIAEFALVIGISAAINRLSLATATMLFILYSAIVVICLLDLHGFIYCQCVFHYGRHGRGDGIYRIYY